MTPPRGRRPDPLHPDRNVFGRRFDSILAGNGVGMSLGMWAGRGDWAEFRQESRDGAGLRALHDLSKLVDELSALRDDLAADLERRPELDRSADAPNAHVTKEVRQADGGWRIVRELPMTDALDLDEWRRRVREGDAGHVVAADWGIEPGTEVQHVLYEGGYQVGKFRTVAVESSSAGRSGV